MPLPAPLTIVETARTIAGYLHVERRLFEIVGGWVPSVPEPQVKVALAVAARRYGWRASLWAEQQPVLHDVDERTLAPSAAVDGFLDAVGGSTTSYDRVVAVYDVALPALGAAYEAHAERASPVCDGPVIHTLELVSRDVRALVREAPRVPADRKAEIDGESAAGRSAQRLADQLRELLPPGALAPGDST